MSETRLASPKSCVDRAPPKLATVLFVLSCATFAGAQVRACRTPSLSIPDNFAAGASDTLTIGSSVIIGAITVKVEVAHSYVGDLIITLTHLATGTTVRLMDRPGDPMVSLGCTQNNIDALFDEYSGITVESTCNPCTSTPPACAAISGIVHPEDSFSAFTSLNAASDWRLNVSDHSAGDMGTLVRWCITITSAVCAYPSVAIPDFVGSPGSVTHRLAFADSGSITGMSVYNEIGHSYVGDLTIDLTHVSSGTTVRLMDRPGAPATPTGCDQNNIVTFFADFAFSPVEAVCRPCGLPPPTCAAISSPSGFVTPQQPLATFFGLDPQGNWDLRVTDNVSGDVGTLAGWCLYIAVADTSCATTCGDCNQDSVGPLITDALVAAQIGLMLIAPSMSQLSCCDVNSDGSVGVVDALRIAQVSVGIVGVVVACP